MLNSEVGGEIQESTSIEHGEGMNMVRPAQWPVVVALKDRGDIFDGLVEKHLLSERKITSIYRTS